jgi:hypothetical protein
MNEQDEAQIAEIDDKLRKTKEIAKILLRSEVWLEIGSEMLMNKVRKEHLDSSLWDNYDHWKDKFREIEIRDDDDDREGIDRREVNKFKEKTIAAIRKRGVELEAGINNPFVDEVRSGAIESIERELVSKNLKPEDFAITENK